MASSRRAVLGTILSALLGAAACSRSNEAPHPPSPDAPEIAYGLQELERIRESAEGLRVELEVNPEDEPAHQEAVQIEAAAVMRIDALSQGTLRLRTDADLRRLQREIRALALRLGDLRRRRPFGADPGGAASDVAPAPEPRRAILDLGAREELEAPRLSRPVALVGLREVFDPEGWKVVGRSGPRFEYRRTRYTWSFEERGNVGVTFDRCEIRVWRPGAKGWGSLIPERVRHHPPWRTAAIPLVPGWRLEPRARITRSFEDPFAVLELLNEARFPFFQHVFRGRDDHGHEVTAEEPVRSYEGLNDPPSTWLVVPEPASIPAPVEGG